MEIKKILVVEDEAYIAIDMKLILDKEGYHTLIDCFSVDRALELIKEECPDLVLIDVNLNGVKNGLDLARLLKNEYQIPFIFITSFSDKDTLRVAADLAPSAYITKPFKPLDLITAAFLALKQRERLEDNQSDTVMPFVITQALDFIDSHLKEKIDLSTLAKHSGWEAEHFSKVFKQFVGMAPYQYILKSRVELSKKLLSQPGEFSQSICYEVGFSTYSNFYNSFKKFTSMSPLEYKKLISKES
jgi:YesN/AraC family two-component response regulator